MASAPPLVQPFTDDSHPNDQASALGIFIEPLVVVSLLAAGVIINRRPLSPVSRAYSRSLPHLLTYLPHTPFLPPLLQAMGHLPLRQQLDLCHPLPLPVHPRGVLLGPHILGLPDCPCRLGGLVHRRRDRRHCPRHAIQLLEFERRIGIQWENKVQDTIMQHAWALSALNRDNRLPRLLYHTQPFRVYAPVRRTMALANLLAFVVFTLWPCMPPRLLPAAYSFVDTVHKHGAGSVWTTNKFCNPPSPRCPRCTLATPSSSASPSAPPAHNHPA
ncbi:hypothetical protein EDB84DRAFT_710198, partial [Lactarius hengduanensis]